MAANKWLIFIIMVITLLYSIGNKNKHSEKLCVQVITVVLTCFSGFRSWQMGDVFHYCYAYLECNTPGWKLDLASHDTIGLQLFFHGAGRIGLSFEACLFIIAAFVAVTLGLFVYKYSPSPYWSYTVYIAIGFYISSFNILKQIIAMTFVVLAMISVIEHKPVRFVIFVAFAALFHFPAVIFIVAYPFANKKVDVAYFGMVFVMIAAVFVFREQIVHQATQIYYIDDMSFTAAESVGGKAIMMALILAFALVLRPLKQHDTVYRQTFNVLVLALVVQTFSVYDNVFSRLADYFFQFIVLFIPLMFQPGFEQAEQYPGHIKEIRYIPKGVYKIMGGCVTVFAIWFYIRYVNANAALLSDFHFFWEVDVPYSLDMLKDQLVIYGGY